MRTDFIKQKPNAWLANGLAAIALIIMLSSIGFKDTVVLFSSGTLFAIASGEKSFMFWNVRSTPI